MSKAKHNTIQEEAKQYVVFQLNDEDYGIEIHSVEIIERMMMITRVPKTPKFIKGVINLRGEIVPVLSLRERFNLGEEEYSSKTRIIIVKINDAPIGLIVDVVKEVLEFTPSMIEELKGSHSDIDQEYILGIGKYNKEIVTILDLTKFDQIINQN